MNTEYYQHKGTKLGQIVPDIQLPEAAALIRVRGLCDHTRAVQPGLLFLALKGAKFDATKHFDDAVERGAVAILFQPNKKKQHGQVQFLGKVPLIAVNKLDALISQLATDFYPLSQSSLTLIGVTGTNGKTSVVWLLYRLLKLSSNEVLRRVGAIGTLGTVDFKGTCLVDGAEPRLTTPNRLGLQKILHDFVNRGVAVAAMEASSHGLTQGRVEGLPFNLAVFTNLSHEHLDYHGDIESYREAKASLFQLPGLAKAVINIDDDFGSQLVKRLRQQGHLQQLYSYSVSDRGEADIYVASREGQRLAIVCWAGEMEIQLPENSFEAIEVNISNLLAAIGVACALGMELDDIVASIGQIEAVPGRLQRIANDRGIQIFLDYAHTADALSKVLKQLKESYQGRLIAVFGCGGDRDKSKRSPMVEQALKYADRVILTTDNPRTESPKKILDDMRNGRKLDSQLRLEADRAKAIKQALDMARSGDTVILAGKGAECYQLVGEQYEPFSDSEQVTKWLSLDKPGLTFRSN